MIRWGLLNKTKITQRVDGISPYLVGGFSPTHLKHMSQNGNLPPIFGVHIKKYLSCHHLDTVDGSEIRRSPVEIGTLSRDLQGFIHPGWCRILSIKSISNRIISPRRNIEVGVRFKECLWLLRIPLRLVFFFWPIDTLVRIEECDTNLLRFATHISF